MEGMTPVPEATRPTVYYRIRVDMVGGGSFELCEVHDPRHVSRVVDTLLEAWGASNRKLEVWVDVNRE